MELEGSLRAAQLEREQTEATLRQQMAEQAQFKDQTIRDREDEIERLRSQRSRLSTKLIGETLEQHCEMEFNRWRATAFTRTTTSWTTPRATTSSAMSTRTASRSSPSCSR